MKTSRDDGIAKTVQCSFFARARSGSGNETKSHEALETAHSITMASCATPFSSYVRIRRATLNFELKNCVLCAE